MTARRDPNRPRRDFGNVTPRNGRQYANYYDKHTGKRPGRMFDTEAEAEAWLTAHRPADRESTAKERLRTALLKAYRQHRRAGALPTSARFLFYELSGWGVVGKKGSGLPDSTYMTRVLTELRKEGAIPWAAIVDETRSLDSWRCSPSVAEHVLKSVHRARLDPWAGDRPLVITESRSLAGVLRRTAMRYLVDIASVNGQCAGFLHTDLGPMLQETESGLVLYFGDLDKHGALIEDNTREVLADIVDHELTWQRLAITQAQVDEFELPAMEKPDGSLAWETEALGQTRIGSLLVGGLDDLRAGIGLDSIDDFIDHETEQIEAEVEALREFYRGRGLID